MPKKQPDRKEQALQAAQVLSDCSQVFFGIVRLPEDDALVLLKGEPAELINTFASHLEHDDLLLSFLTDCIEMVKARAMQKATAPVVPMGKRGQA